MPVFFSSVLNGFVLPSLPNGGWSITVELHYYLILPLLLRRITKSSFDLVWVVATAILLRLFYHHFFGEVQSLAYWTIAGRIDQFVLGMFAYQARFSIAKRHVLALGTITAFLLFYWYFDGRGGFYLNPSYPSTSPLWIFLPTIEGLTYAISITWYDNSFSHSTSGISKFIGRIGEYSYSNYLLHFFVVFKASRFINERIMDISNFYLACLWSSICFILMVIPGYISFRFIESPFLRLRKCYIKASCKSHDK